jgi:GNAT superfamily N-acetyltransferase
MTGLPVGYELIEDQSAIDAVAAHAYLTRSYWSPGIPLDTVCRAIAGSICVAIRFEGDQVAFARIVSDCATFAYLADVYVLEEHRCKGLSHAMLAHFLAHPSLQGLRRWALFTQDAQGLYSQHGWTQYPFPERMMTRDNPDVYQ